MSSIENINPLFIAASELQDKFHQLNWRFCFIGGLAVLRWGEIRMTQDIDLCLLCGFGFEKNYVPLLLREFKSRISDALNFALENRVVLIYASNGVPVDISLSGLPFEEAMIKRASYFEFYPDINLLTCSAEDLIILKAFADRTKDWLDVEGIIARQAHKLDQSYILKQLAPLCDVKNAPEIISKLESLFQNR